MKDIAFLVYYPLKQRRVNNSFEGNDNIGAKVITHVLEQFGHRVERCSVKTARKYKIILVSFTSTNDLLAYYREVAQHPDWQPSQRKFKIVGGGFGMQNPTVIRDYIDYAVFGRAENFISDVVADIFDDKTINHPSVMNLPDMHIVKIAQSDNLYPHAIGKWRESFIGCPLKCKFCHFTFSRKRIGYGDSYVQTDLTDSNSPELTWDGLFTWGKKIGRGRVAIDGFSERLRYIYGKKISNQEIIDGLECVGQYEGNTVLTVYNIANMPYETEEDRQSLYDTLNKVAPSNRVIFVLHSTPFRASTATPMQWEHVNIADDWSKKRSEVIVEKENFRAVHSWTLETNWSQFLSMVIERASPETDELFRAIAFSKHLRNKKDLAKLNIVRRNFDIDPYIREYDFDELHPAWFLESYINRTALVKMARKIRANIDKSQAVPDWLPSGKTIVQSRLQSKHQ